MKTLKYRVIKSKTQYKEYSKILEALIFSSARSSEIRAEIELLTLLIEKWDSDHNTFNDLDPVKFLHALMEEHALKAKDLAEILHVSKGYVSDILHYKKSFSKGVIRNLSNHFRVGQEAFNRPYKLRLNHVSIIAAT